MTIVTLGGVQAAPLFPVTIYHLTRKWIGSQGENGCEVVFKRIMRGSWPLLCFESRRWKMALRRNIRPTERQHTYHEWCDQLSLCSIKNIALKSPLGKLKIKNILHLHICCFEISYQMHGLEWKTLQFLRPISLFLVRYWSLCIEQWKYWAWKWLVSVSPFVRALQPSSVNSEYDYCG